MGMSIGWGVPFLAGPHVLASTLDIWKTTTSAMMALGSYHSRMNSYRVLYVRVGVIKALLL